MLNEFAGKHSLAVRYEDALNDESALQKNKSLNLSFISTAKKWAKARAAAKKKPSKWRRKSRTKKLITNK
ncbi:MAG: hypothetical protein L6V85_06830 [Clostridiales bacterium]|nr:MAG: hypothetical protein L6V85_06830 [Clostridiales bacterium]